MNLQSLRPDVNLDAMELLEQLEKQVERLLERDKRLEAENSRLRQEAEMCAVQNTALEGKCQTLEETLAHEASRRGEAVRRIDALLLAMRENDGVE